MYNGDVIDCNPCKGPTLIPSNFTYIEKFVTTAQLVLVIEKFTVFQNLIANDIFSLLNGDIVLVTARGYPDVSTRWILHKMWLENHLPMYILVDGDPFGIEIMLIYRYGSDAQTQHVDNLYCPHLKWLGIHPSDICNMTMNREPFTTIDNNKIESLLRRPYLDDDILTELLILQMLQSKVKIDNLSKDTFSSFTINYIVNKIKRQIVL
ncbi:meiotic W68 isoform 1-T3 [Cochliomyia hominivorax]